LKSCFPLSSLFFPRVRNRGGGGADPPRCLLAAGSIRDSLKRSSFSSSSELFGIMGSPPELVSPSILESGIRNDGGQETFLSPSSLTAMVKSQSVASLRIHGLRKAPDAAPPFSFLLFGWRMRAMAQRAHLRRTKNRAWVSPFFLPPFFLMELRLSGRVEGDGGISLGIDFFFVFPPRRLRWLDRCPSPLSLLSPP